MGWAGPKPGTTRFRPGLGLKSVPINKWAGLGLSGRKAKAWPGPALENQSLTTVTTRGVHGLGWPESQSGLNIFCP